MFLIADDHARYVLGCEGNTRAMTPNLDRLVQRGVTFTNAYSPCPVCVPARYSIRTGCEPPTTRMQGRFRDRLREFPRLITEDRDYAFFDA